MRSACDRGLKPRLRAVGRRDAVKLIGEAVLALGGAPTLTGCSGPTRSSVAGNDSGVPGLDPVLADVLFHASLAPSGHNAQPWLVRVLEPNRLLIGTTRDRWLPAVDPVNRELFLSLGCFLENLIVTARHRGLDLDYRTVGATPGDTEVLEVTLRPAQRSSFVLDAILQRRCVRSHHQAQELRSADVQALSAPFGDQLAFFPSGSAQARWLAEATVEANRVQANRDPAQEELSRWIRWSDDDAREHRNGLTTTSMEITGLSGWYMRHFMNPSSAMTADFRERGVARVREQVQSCGGWLVITSPAASVAALVETGRMFERMWLGCRERMLAIHPMSQVLEETPFRDLVNEQLGVTGHVQFVVRASYLARYPEPVSLRMPVSRFVSGVAERASRARAAGEQRVHGS